MKTQYKVIALSVVFGVFAWVIDTLLDYFFFYEGTFWGLLIYDVPIHEVYIRLVVFLSFVVFGVLMSRILAERKRTEEALLKAHEELEIRVEERTKELAKANEELRIEVTQRRKAEDQMRASLKEKELLLREIHHRVKNNLQVISSLLDFQSGYIKDKQTLEMFEESQNRIRSMALIHEQLYQSQDLARIDFAEYIRNLSDQLLSTSRVNFDTITLKINVDDVFLGIDTAIPCGLIINELVSNSLKHAFPEGKEGQICIDLYSDKDNKFTLMVRDDGVGFPQDLGFQNTKSLGLQLVSMLTRQLEGTIELNRSGGTEFKIAFTALKYKEGG